MTSHGICKTLYSIRCSRSSHPANRTGNATDSRVHSRQHIVEHEKELGEAQAGVLDALQAGAQVQSGTFRASSLRVTDRYTHLIVTA
jgi:hypothetical protein